MAKYYTVSKFETTGRTGSTSGAGSFTSGGTLTITPKTGYAVKASDFSVPTLPKEISSITFSDTTTGGEPKNLVTATFIFNPAFLIPNKNVSLFANIVGTAKLILNSYESQEVDVYFEIENSTNQTGDGEEVHQLTTPSDGDLVTKHSISVGTGVDGVNRPGFEFHTVSAKVQPGVLTYLAKGSYQSNSATKDFIFNKKPYIRLNKEAKGKVIFKNIKYYFSNIGFKREKMNKITFDVYYKNTVDTNASDMLRARLVTQNVLSVERGLVIDSVTVGDSNISAGGETRPIKIKGTKDAEFQLTVIKKSTNESILDSKYVTGTTLDSMIGKIDCFNKKIDKNGSCNLIQKFPSTEILRKFTSGSITSGSTITLDSIDGLKEGDRLIATDRTQVGRETLRYISSINTAAKQVTLNGVVTISDNKDVVFDRSESYYLSIEPFKQIDWDVIPSATPWPWIQNTTLGDGVEAMTIATLTDRSYNYKFDQYIDPVIVFKTTTTSAHYTAAASVVRIGRSNTKYGKTQETASSKKYFQLSYTLTCTHPRTFSITKQPVFSNTDQTASDWTNSVTADNGGFEVSIMNMVATLVTNYKVTITADVFIKKFGANTNGHLEMSLPLNTIVGCS